MTAYFFYQGQVGFQDSLNKKKIYFHNVLNLCFEFLL